MIHQRLMSNILIGSLIIPISVQASFIESTIGTAVVNDATAAYYNPAALTLLPNPQIIGLSSFANFRSQFTGQVTQTHTGFTQFGTTNSRTNYFLPSGYLGLPVTEKIFLGLAVLANDFNRDIEQNSVLRYVQSDNSIQNIDLVPAVGVKLNDYLALGAAVNFSQANFLFKPISGFPSLNIPDSESRNLASARAWGADVGILLKPIASTQVGVNYRSALTYQFRGKSVLEGIPGITSDHYGFNFWTPARYVLSVNQGLSKKFSLISTLQYVQWSIFNQINIQNIATRGVKGPIIIPNAIVPLHFRDTWICTLGSNYKLTSQWVIRAAGSYLQAPGNGNYQIINGDSIIVGASTGYDITKNITIDGSYAYAFIQNKNININNDRNIINGINKGWRNSVSVKLTLKI